MSNWEAARSHPFTYPGTHPAGGFALVDDVVHDLVWQAPPQAASIVVDGASTLLDDILSERGLPTLQDRYPVLTYGGNRNPATLTLKLQHYGYASPGKGIVLPVLPARIRGFDAVAGGLSSQGYLYADMYADDRTADTELFVHVLLLDSDQLRVMHDSEGVRSDLYDVVELDCVGFVQDGQRFGFSAMAYVGVDPVVISELLDSPIAFEAVKASGRNLPEFETTAMLAHVLEAIGAVDEVRAVVGAGLKNPDDALKTPREVASELMRYLNGQWWYRQHTDQRRLLACENLETSLRARLLTTSRTSSTRELVSESGRFLSADEAYEPDPASKFGAVLKRGR
jgi:hypothetical protein